MGGRIVVSGGSGSNDDGSARVAPLADGGFVVVRTAELRAGWGEPSRIGLRARAHDAGGTARGPVFAPVADEGFSQADGQPAGLADGGYAIAWFRAAPGTGGDIWTRSFDADGTARGEGAGAHADPLAGPQSAPAVVTLPDGGYRVVWTYPSGVSTRLSEAGDAARGRGACDIDAVADGCPIDLNPTVAVLPDGRIVVAVQRYTVASDIWHSIADARGAAIAGAAGDDDTLGQAPDSRITGRDGNDRIAGLGGNVRLDGGPGGRHDGRRAGRRSLPPRREGLRRDRGRGALTEVAGEVVSARSARLVPVDPDGDGAPDLALRPDRKPAVLDAGDFLC